MATYNKFQDYVEQLSLGKWVWGTDVIKAMLTNSAPVATNTIKANITEITAQNGYSAGGMTMDSVTLTETSGTAKVTMADEVLTATGTVGPFRYVVFYNDTQTSPADPLVCWYDIGSNITMANGDTFTIDMDATNGLWQMT